MKYTTYLALIGSATSMKMSDIHSTEDPDHPECEYHKSDDGLECVKI
jgi:hypothetical protein